MGRHKAAETKTRVVVYLGAADLDLLERMLDGVPASVWLALLVRQEARRRLGVKAVPPKVRPRQTPPTHASVPKYDIADPGHDGTGSGPVVGLSGEPVVKHPLGEPLDAWPAKDGA